MATATVEIWRDTGFTEGSVEVPSKTSSLPTSDYIFTDLNISASDLFSRFKVPHAFEDLYACSYIRIKMDMNNGEDVTLYGWIDNVTCVSDTAEHPVTAVEWHVDLWRTYLSKVTIGSGMVKRRPLMDTDEVPPQDYPVRYYKAEGLALYLATHQYLWCVFVATINYQNAVGIMTCAFPMPQPGSGIPYISTIIDGVTYDFPSLSEVAQSLWDEDLGIDPKSVVSVFISPIAPEESMGGWGLAKNTTSRGNWAYYVKTTQYAMKEYDAHLNIPVKTDDVYKYAICGFDNEVIGTLPWGVTVYDYSYRLIIDSSSAYIQVRFDGHDSHSEGLCFTVPLIPLSLTENATSSYVYSGARQADLMQMRTEADKAYEKGLASTASGTVTGVSSGLMMGALGGPLGMMGGALVGGVSSAIGGTISTTANRGIDYTYNDRFQDITDYRMAHQTNGLLMSGSGLDSLVNGAKGITIRKLKADDYSVEQRASDISLYGVHVSEPRTSCQPLIDNGGPVQITSAVITGTAPASAKRYIKQRLESGVRII